MMLRDFKFLKRKPEEEETENVPLNMNAGKTASSLSSASQTSDDLSSFFSSSSRPPLNMILPGHPVQPPNARPEHEPPPTARSKFDRTPTKPKSRPSEPLRTPDRFGGGIPKHRRNSEESSGFPNMTPRSTTTTRATGKANSGYSEGNSTQSTPTKSVSKPSVGRVGGGGNGRGGNGGGGFAALYRGIPSSGGGGSTSCAVVNKVEVPHIDLKEDPSFWMDHNVQVLIRVRPLNSMERSMHGYNRCLKQESAQSITWIGQPETRFTFDHVACETIDQETLFRMAGLPMVENCLSGYNSCIFAYGQTGSGKTYTMLGEIDNVELKPSLHRGMTPRIFEFLFARIQAEEESRWDERLKYNCKCSFLEIYNEQITDLLDPSSSNLLLREDVKKGVYVENLSECDVHTVSDILKLLTQGSLNRKVAATNMNRESSRSHCVFTCVIESRWEKDSTTNLRFARLNLVDLAGSERQKSSGAEGERLKEAANINKSLSTLGHVIMVLVDVAHGKQRHIPYRDSRLTFLLQDSLGGNSKTMIVANVSPSICCAAETLNTLKFAQRAKLIQNNAVVNEDATGDVLALQHQLRLLKEELAVLKRQNVFRSLSFSSNANSTLQEQGSSSIENNDGADEKQVDAMLGFEPKGIITLSTKQVTLADNPKVLDAYNEMLLKQLKSLETTLAGALRREQMAETSIKKIEAEIEQLNRLVRQREEDTRSTKMMLRFREDKIQRMESLLGSSLPPDAYLLEDNRSLSEEIQLLRAKVDKNPEVTRFALENIRLLDQLRRFQEFYEEGEREILLDEISNLRDQLLQFLNEKSSQHDHPNLYGESQEHPCNKKHTNTLHFELKDAPNELEECRSKLNSCLEENEKLRREAHDLNAMLGNLKYGTRTQKTDGSVNNTKESMWTPYSANSMFREVEGNIRSMDATSFMNHGDEILDLQLEVDILKIILKEEKSSRAEVEERAFCLNRDLELAESKLLFVRKEYEDATHEIREAKSVIAALESRQISAIEEIEDLKKNNDHYARCLSEKEGEIMILKNQSAVMDLRDDLSNNQECGDSNLHRKFMRMHNSLEKARRLNIWYQNNLAFQASNEEEKDQVCRQAEAETADVIVCMQEELSILQQHFEDCKLKEMETKQAMLLLETELQELQERLSLSSEDNKRLHGKLEQKDMQLKMFSEEWELLTCEMEEVLSDGQEALADASGQLDLITSSLPQRRISENVGRLTRFISQKDLLIEELGRSLEDANAKRIEMEFMLQSLRGASMMINEAHQQECSEREKETVQLRSQLREKISTVIELERKVKLAEHQAEKASACATVAFIIVNHLSEVNSHNASELKSKDNQLSESVAANLRKESILVDQAASVEEAEKVFQSLKLELVELRDTRSELQQRLSEKEKHASALEQKLEHLEEIDLMKIGEKLAELSSGVSSVKSSMYIHAEPDISSQTKEAHSGCMPVDVNDIWTDAGEDLRTDLFRSSSKIVKSSRGSSSDERSMEFGRFSPDAYDRDNAIILLKKEIECAFESLQEVQVEITKHRVEKEQLFMSEQQYQENMESFGTQLFALQAALCNFEKQLDLKIKAIDQKLQCFEHTFLEALMHWSETKEILELEIGDARVYAAQKAAEASCIYAKFEEAQDTLKDADIMLNELMIANEKTKLDLEKLKQKENRFTNERDKLIDKVRSLQSIVDQKDQHIHDLEEQYGLELMETKDQVVQLEVIISQVQATYEESFRSVVYDFHDIRSVILESGKLVQSWIEDIWSETLVKDCSISVMHLCHLGILLETVTGLNAENVLLCHGLCASDSVISDLRERNCRTNKELQMFRTLKGKLLVDIKSGFDRISRKEEEAGQFGRSLTSFEKKILDLQLQEELMFERANDMGSQLTILVEELKLSNRKFNESLSDQDKMLKDREKLLHSQTELFVVDLWTKDVELRVLESQLKEVGLQKAAAEIEYGNCGSFLENVKGELIVSKVDGALKEQELFAKDAEAALLQKKVVEAQGETKKLLCMLKECNLRITEMDEVNRAFAQDVKLLKEVALSNDALRGELTESVQTKVKLMDQIQALEAERQTLLNELKINSATLKELGCQRDVMQRECIRSEAVTENLKKDVILLLVEQGLKEQMQLVEDSKVAILEKEVEAARLESQDLLLRLRQSNLRITEADEAKQNLEREVLLLKNVALTNDMLKCELNEVMENKERLSSQVQELEGECKKLLRSLKTKETALEISSHHMLLMDEQKQQFEADISRLETLLNKVQKELDIKDLELSKMSCMEEENKSVGSEVAKLRNENSLILSDLERKNYDMQLSLNKKNDVDIENFKLHERILFLETMIASLQSHLETKKAEVNHILQSQSEVMADLCSKKRNLEDEKVTLRDEYESVKKDVREALTSSDSNAVRCIDSLENACSAGYRLFEVYKGQGFKVIEKLLHEFSGNAEKICQFINEIESLECHIKGMVSDNVNLNAELLRKDDILKGLLFDLSLLQESASNSKDEKDKVEEMMASLVALEDELLLKSGELEEYVAHNQMLEAQFQEKINMISTLESNFMKEHESNLELRSQLEEALGVKYSLEEELTEKKSLIEKLEMGLSQMCNDIGKMSDTIESLRSKLSDLTDERDELEMEINLLKEELEKARALAEENEAIALEAQQIAESTRVHAEEKEAEVKLLERSVEELECTINVLENKVDILKGEAERQRLQREELEEELLAVNHHMQNVKSADTDIKSYLDAKERDLEQALKKMKILERDMADKDKEIAKCNAHISELNLHAEAQASEYKQKFKELEAMAEQVKPEVHFSQIACSSSNKSEKNVVKSRGSGSPFKCIGLGLAQQMKSEKEEELTAARLHIEELESQAACRQKEIFALNARLAAAESMTHDVIRDLLGVKLDMTNYVSLLDSRQVQKIAEDAQLSNLQPLVKDQEVMRLKQQLNEFIEERQGWLEEIDRKQAEMSAAQIALEKIRQQDQLLKTENEVLKMENANHKNRVMELEGEVKRLSSQQNLHHRIHHHAKIKEENNMLKLQNEDLTAKLRHTEVIIVRVKEELAHYRASGGKRPCINFDEEQRLTNKLKETEDDRVQLAQKLLAMCTSILKAAGITKPAAEISPAVAEEALEQLKNRITSLERGVQDLMFKNRISNERIRLSELRPQASPIINSRTDENYSTPRRGQASFLSDFDR